MTRVSAAEIAAWRTYDAKTIREDFTLEDLLRLLDTIAEAARRVRELEIEIEGLRRGADS